MKALDQVASTGIALNSANTPGDSNYHFIINQPGAYFLTGNLGVTKTNGIRVNAVGVTIDLNGFEISRSSGSGGDGITVISAAHRCTIRNGSLNGFAQGINSLGTAARGCLFRNLSADNCTNYGIRAGEAAVLQACRARNCGGTAGILAGNASVLADCTASGNSADSAIQSGPGSALSNCIATNGSGTSGINVGAGSVLTDCTSLSNNVSGSGITASTGSALTNCIARSNTAANGILVGSGSALNKSNASANTATYGILASFACALSECTTSSNTSAASVSAGIGTSPGCVISRCSSYFNRTTATNTNTTGMGFDVGSGSIIQDSTAANNPGDGINISNDTFCRNNNASGNGQVNSAAGIHATSSDNRIEGNIAALNFLRNYAVDGTGSILIKNTASIGVGVSGPINYAIAAGNSYGVIVDDIAGSDFIVFGTSSSSSFGSPNAFANFSH